MLMGNASIGKERRRPGNLDVTADGLQFLELPGLRQG